MRASGRSYASDRHRARGSKGNSASRLSALNKQEAWTDEDRDEEYQHESGGQLKLNGEWDGQYRYPDSNKRPDYGAEHVEPDRVEEVVPESSNSTRVRASRQGLPFWSSKPDASISDYQRKWTGCFNPPPSHASLTTFKYSTTEPEPGLYDRNPISVEPGHGFYNHNEISTKPGADYYDRKILAIELGSGSSDRNTFSTVPSHVFYDHNEISTGLGSGSSDRNTFSTGLGNAYFDRYRIPTEPGHDLYNGKEISYENVTSGFSTPTQQLNTAYKVRPLQSLTALAFSQSRPSVIPGQQNNSTSDGWLKETSNSDWEMISKFEAPQVENRSFEIEDDPEYVVVAKPEGYFKLGRIFNTFRALRVQTFVVMDRYKYPCSVCCLLRQYSTTSDRSGENSAPIFVDGSLSKLHNMSGFPIIVENPSVTVDPGLRIDFSRVYTIDHTTRVRTVGRVDRKCLKTLEATFLKAKKVSVPEDVDLEVDQEDNDSKTNISEPLTRHEYQSNSPTSHRTDYTKTEDWKLPAEVRNQSFRSVSPVESTTVGDEEFSFKNHITSSSQRTSSRQLDSSYKVHSSKYFKRGIVFKTLWSEPLGKSSIGTDRTGRTGWDRSDPSSTDFARYGEMAYHSIRRFVIAKEAEGHCLCLPILTYGYQGTTKPGVKPESHAIIYSTKKVPAPMRGEDGLLKEPVRMESRTASDALDPASRVNYDKIYTVEHNIKVCFIGKIHRDSFASFLADLGSTLKL